MFYINHLFTVTEGEPNLAHRIELEKANNTFDNREEPERLAEQMREMLKKHKGK